MTTSHTFREKDDEAAFVLEDGSIITVIHEGDSLVVQSVGLRQSLALFPSAMNTAHIKVAR